MKRSAFFIFVCVLALPLVTFAQGGPGWDKMSLGASFEVSLPMGDFQNAAGTGYGGNVRYQYGTGMNVAFTATAGYLVWTSKDMGAGTSMQPQAFNVFLGGKYFLPSGFFGSLEGGLYFMSYAYTGNVVGASGNATRFMIPIGIGYQSTGFELGVRYMPTYREFNNFSFTVGYNFPLQ